MITCLNYLPRKSSLLYIDKGKCYMKSKEFMESLVFFRNTQMGEGLRKSTVSAYGSDVEKFLIFLEEERKISSLEKIKFQYITIYRDSLLKKGFKLTTIDRKMNSLSKYFAFLADNGLLEVNLMGRFKQKKQPTDKSPHFLTFDEMCQIIATAKCEGDVNANRDAALLATYAFIGCRREEAANLTWGQINFERKTLLLKRTKVSSYDTLKIKDDLCTLLMDYYLECMHCQSKYPKPNAPVFCGEKGLKISLKTVNRLFLKYAKLAGIQQEFSITPHIFRNSFCTHLAVAGHSIIEIAEYTGHKDIKTLSKYIKLSVNQYKDVTKSMPSMQGYLSRRQSAQGI